MFKGVYTALITPFNDDESVDYDAVKKLVELQIASGVAGIVPMGTTGESPTLSHEEHKAFIKKVIEIVNGRCKIIAGTGSNSTAEAVEMTKQAESDGADACLVVNPYYNKPTQEGLYRHFKGVCDSVKIPIVLYNIKGRTAVNVETATLLRLIEDCPNMLAVKEASGDLNQIRDVISKVPSGFSVLSGDDGIILELIKAGGHGVISVASNVIPAKMVEFVDLCLAGDFDAAAKKNEGLIPFFKGEFIETNPIPIKAAVAMMGLCKEVYRLPMCEMSQANRAKWREILVKYSLV